MIKFAQSLRQNFNTNNHKDNMEICIFRKIIKYESQGQALRIVTFYPSSKVDSKQHLRLLY